MKILFVVGGSYKAFYLNNIQKYKELDLLIFQNNILYEYDYYNENFGEKTITNEMMSLQEKLHCKIIAKIKTNLCGIKKDEVLYCDNNGVKILNNNRYMEIFIKNKKFFISNYCIIAKSEYFIYFLKNKNDFCIPRRNYDNIYFSKKSIFFVCDKCGVNMIKNNFMTRKFRKICYFSLKFWIFLL